MPCVVAQEFWDCVAGGEGLDLVPNYLAVSARNRAVQSRSVIPRTVGNIFTTNLILQERKNFVNR
jgi:hypothetical protein